MRYFLDPFGCAKNQVDAETIMARLDGVGWEMSEAEDADLIIVNSCGFIEAAKRESINAVLGWKQRYPDKKILLAGCLAQRYRAELSASLPEADILLGCDELEETAARAGMITAAPKGPAARPNTSPSMSLRPDRGLMPSMGLRPLLGFPGQGYVKISEGCDNRCSFCAIPLIRGPLRCRTIPDVVNECTALLGRGVKELCLIGQDIASYNPPPEPGDPPPKGSGLAALLKSIAALPGTFWVRLLYLHPDHFPLDILDLIQTDRRFLPYFDIPFQHASDRILKAMGRTGDAATYLRLLDTIRKKLPDAVIRSTFLAGFPGEAEDDFRLLLDFQKAARFDWLGVFAYSREEGTPAWSMKGRVSKKTAAERKARIEEAQIPVTEERMNRFVGRTMDVLIEEEVESGLWLGRLFCQAPEVDGAAVVHFPPHTLKPGDMVEGAVIGRAGFDLEVRLTA